MSASTADHHHHDRRVVCNLCQNIDHWTVRWCRLAAYILEHLGPLASTKLPPYTTVSPVALAGDGWGARHGDFGWVVHINLRALPEATVRRMRGVSITRSPRHGS